MLVGYRVFFVEGDNDSSAAGMDIRQFDQRVCHLWSQQSAIPTTFQDKNVINIRHFDIDIRQNGINMRVLA